VSCRCSHADSFSFWSIPLLFYASDRHEPPHIHIERDASKTKFWLEPISLQSSAGFSPAELKTIYRLIEQHQALLLQHWHDYFDP
jgi:hypothetical protein